MNNKHQISCVVLSLLQTALGVFAAFFSCTLLLGATQTGFNDCVSDALAKSFIVSLGILLSWFIGQKKMKSGEKGAKASFVSKTGRNMMISNVVTTFICWLLWISTRKQYNEMNGVGSQNILLCVAIMSVVITVIVIMVNLKLQKVYKISNLKS